MYIYILKILVFNVYKYMWNEINFRNINRLKSLDYYVVDEKYHQLIWDYIKDSVGNIINIDYNEQIRNIKNHQDLINFISIFKWKSENEKLSFIYFQEFTKQMLLYIINIHKDELIKIYKDIFWKSFQRNEYDKNGCFFGNFRCAAYNDEGQKFALYYWNKLFKEPVDYNKIYWWWYTEDEINNLLL